MKTNTKRLEEVMGVEIVAADYRNPSARTRVQRELVGNC